MNFLEVNNCRRKRAQAERRPSNDRAPQGMHQGFRNRTELVQQNVVPQIGLLAMNRQAIGRDGPARTWRKRFTTCLGKAGGYQFFQGGSRIRFVQRGFFRRGSQPVAPGLVVLKDMPVPAVGKFRRCRRRMVLPDMHGQLRGRHPRMTMPPRQRNVSDHQNRRENEYSG